MPIPKVPRWGWLTSVLVLVVVLVTVPVIRGFIGRGLIGIATPFVSAGRWVADRSILGIGDQKLKNQRDALQHQVTDLTNRLYEVSQQLESANVLSDLSSFAAASKHHLVTAGVIASSPDPGIQSIVINRGSDDDLALGQAVISEQGFVVGKITTLHQTTSVVLLLSDRQSVIAGRVQNTAQSPGVVRGEHGLALQMGFIPKSDEVRVGQTVVTTGTESGIPPDLLIGAINAINSRSGDLFQQASVTPAAPLERIRIVAVVIS